MIIRFYNWVERQGSPHLLGERNSGRGQPQSKTLTRAPTHQKIN